jgi:hypothetical protein
MEKEILIFLLQKHIAGTLTESEKAELATYLDKKQSKELTTSVIEEMLFQHSGRQQFDEKRSLPLVTAILKADAITDDGHKGSSNTTVQKITKKGSGNRKMWWAAAVLMIAAATAFYFYYFNRSAFADTIGASKPLINDAAPGSNKAVLTVSDGSEFFLDSLKNGFIAQQGNVKLYKDAKGTLTYKGSSEMNEAILFNTVMTPRGGQYQIQLSDGSRVKLNAFSSITYPVWFTGNERSVTVTGEAYFEIAENAKMPFKVNAYEVQVEVKGTEFNINAYSDEPAIKTTLLKGAVQVTKNSATHVLEPLQEGRFDKQGNFSLQKNVDANEVLAWRNGLFQFNKVDLKAVLRQVSRWYDVDILYESRSPVYKEIDGEIRRNVNLSEVVKILEKNGVRCRIEGKTLIVLP